MDLKENAEILSNVKEEYEKLLINCPKDGENPFEYEGSDKPYFIYMTNRNMNCSKLFDTELVDGNDVSKLLESLDGDHEPMQFGYTNLDLLERQFVLFMGDTEYSEIYKNHLKDKLLFCKNGVLEDDCVADILLFVYKENKESSVRTTNAEWKYHPNIIKALTGKSQYSINDAKIIIDSMRNAASCVYACIGAKILYSEYWH